MTKQTRQAGRDHFTHAELLKLFSYDPETGELTRLTGRAAGKQAAKATKKREAPVVTHKEFTFQASQLAYMLHTGSWPPRLCVIAFKDGDRKNLRFDNIAVTQQKARRNGTPLRDAAEAALKAMGSGTVEDMARHCGIDCKSALFRPMERLVELGKAHVEDWLHGSLVKIYAYGPGESMPKPSRAGTEAQQLARKRQIRNANQARYALRKRGNAAPSSVFQLALHPGKRRLQSSSQC